MMDYLFVYGTLMLKYPYNPFRKVLEKHSTFYSEASCKGDLYRISDYPGMTLGHGKVFGEILEIKDVETLFFQLDEYEGYTKKDPTASQYLRDRIVCNTESGKDMICWIYIFNKDIKGLRKIENGRFYQKKH